MKKLSNGSSLFTKYRLRLLIVMTLMLLAFLIIYYIIPSNYNNKFQINGATFEVQNGPLTISVNESGTIKARDQVIIKNEVEGKTSIIWLIPEGTLVKKGDLLVELDSSQLIDEKIEQEIRVQNANSSYIGARENLAVVKNQAKSDVDKAKLDREFAKQDLQKYIEGEYPNALKEAESRITLAQEELRRAEERLEWSKKLFNEKYISQIELQADELAAKTKSLELELAENNLDLLKNYTHKKRLAELESAVSQADMAFDRISRKTKADMVQADADLKAKESEYERQKDKLFKIEKQLEKTKIYAPSDGLVIYATSAKPGGRFSRTEPLSEGQMVQERQELIYLPTSTAVNAEIGIHETSLKNVKPGMLVNITVDALPGKSFSGRMEKIAVLPNAESSWLNPDLKVYDAEVILDGDGSLLRSGMNCLAEIIIEHYDEAIYIPIQAVIRIDGYPTVYVKEGKGFKPRRVEIGLDNNKMIRIINGLKPGEIVLLTPPFDQTIESPFYNTIEKAPQKTTTGQERMKQNQEPLYKTEKEHSPLTDPNHPKRPDIDTNVIQNEPKRKERLKKDIRQETNMKRKEEIWAPISYS